MRIFVHDLAQVTGLKPYDRDAHTREFLIWFLGLWLCLPIVLPALCCKTRCCTAERQRQAQFERELRAWQENATAQLRTVIPGAVVKTQMHVKGIVLTTKDTKGHVLTAYRPMVTKRDIVIALTPEEGSLLRDEPHLTGDSDGCSSTCVCCLCYCLGQQNGACVCEPCNLQITPGAPEGVDYYEWSKDKRCATVRGNNYV